MVTLDAIKEVRSVMLKQWNFVSRLGGEWNDAYMQGLDFALHEIDILIADHETKQNNFDKTLKELHHMPVKTELNKKHSCKKECSGKCCN